MEGKVKVGSIEFVEIDKEGLPVELYLVDVYEGEEPRLPNKNCVPTWGVMQPDDVFDKPSYNRALGKWVEHDPSFAQSQVEKRKAYEDIANLQKYLDETDWYVVRNLESNKPIPQDILAEREKNRNAISELRSKHGIGNGLV